MMLSWRGSKNGGGTKCERARCAVPCESVSSKCMVWYGAVRCATHVLFISCMRHPVIHEGNTQQRPTNPRVAKRSKPSRGAANGMRQIWRQRYTNRSIQCSTQSRALRERMQIEIAGRRRHMGVILRYRREPSSRQPVAARRFYSGQSVKCCGEGHSVQVYH